MMTLARRNSSIHKVREYALPNIDLEEEYEVLQVLQEGWRDRILLVEHKRLHHEVVLKALHQESTSKLEFFREFHYNYYLSPHTHILNAYDVAFQAGNYYVFAQEYAPFGDLTINLSESGLGEPNIKKVVPQIVSALEFMHSKDLVHRNINTDNILVFNIDFSEVKLCDFGSTRKNGSLMKRKMISLPYAPPEVADTVQNEGYYINTKEDVWQLGILLYILLTGALPWQKADLTDHRYNEWIQWKKRKIMKTPKRFSNFTARALRMFKRLLEPKPEKRCTVREVSKYLDDRWLIRPMKKINEDKDSCSICYSNYSIHSSKIEKDQILRTLKEHGIETTVDRNAKRKRIHEWIEKSLSNNLMFDYLEFDTKDHVSVFGKEIMCSRLDHSKNLPDVTIHSTPYILNHFEGSLTNGYHPSSEQKIKQFMKANRKNEGKEINTVNQNHVSPLINVKRTTSFHEKSRQQEFKPTESPCINYNEIHATLMGYPRQSRENKISQSRKSLNHSDQSSRESSRQGSRKYSKSKMYQRSKSVARNYHYEFEASKPPKPPVETEKQEMVKIHGFEKSCTTSEESLTSIVPAVYYQ